MEGPRFDALARMIAVRSPRRALVKALATVALSAGIGLGRTTRTSPARALAAARSCPLQDLNAGSTCRKREICQSDGFGGGFCDRCPSKAKVCKPVGSGDCCGPDEVFCCNDGVSSFCSTIDLGIGAGDGTTCTRA
jgi:hypothetical protein